MIDQDDAEHFERGLSGWWPNLEAMLAGEPMVKNCGITGCCMTGSKQDDREPTEGQLRILASIPLRERETQHWGLQPPTLVRARAVYGEPAAGDALQAAANIEAIRAAVADIACSVGDPEAAHGAEDDLHRGTLRVIAAGAPNAAELAREALKSLDVDFPRWCA